MKDKLRPRYGVTLNEHTKWIDAKAVLHDDPRYSQLKSSSLKEKLFNDFILNEVLTTPGQKRDRLIELGQTEDNAEIVKLEKSEKKRIKKEEQVLINLFKKFLETNVTEVNVSTCYHIIVVDVLPQCDQSNGWIA